MTPQEKDEIIKSMQEAFKNDMRELIIENRIQTLAVLAAFFFGVVTIQDLMKK